MIDNLNSKLAANCTYNNILSHQDSWAVCRAKIAPFVESRADVWGELKSYWSYFERKNARSKGIVIAIFKNEAKFLKDEGILSFIENSDKVANTKNLLRKIVEQHSFNQFETMEKIKGKKYFDKVKDAENELNGRSKKYGLLIE